MPSSPQIALQLYTIRDPMTANLESALAEVANIGYTNVELAGTAGKSAADFKRLLDQNGLKAISAHVGIDQFKDVSKVIGDAQTIGYEYVIVPWIGEEYRSPAGYAKLAAELKSFAPKLKEKGLHLGYHNHDFEFKKLDGGQMPYDILFAGDDLVSELDLYWVVFAGEDPSAWMKKLAKKLPLVHMKDMHKTEKKFAEVGTGRIDLKKLASEAAQHGVRYMVVEQDSGWADNAPLKSARVGFQNLTKMVGG